jgi:outer membrane receptor for ferrienterochelin and colicins
MIKPNKILLFTWVLFCCSTSFVFAQSSTIQLLNAITQEPVADAHVIIKPSEEKNTATIKLISNAEGKIFTDFIGEATLSVSHASFIPLSKKILVETTLEIILEPITIALEDVIVTASFTPTEAKRSLYPVTVIKEESIERRGANNLKDVLKQQLNVRVSQDAILGDRKSVV